MRNNSLQQFVRLRQQLTQERGQLEQRLRQISEALGEMPLPSVSAIQGATPSAPSQPARRGRRAAASGQSLREHVLQVLQEGPKTKEEVLDAVQKRGYKFSTSNPLNSLGVILYGKNPKLIRVDGRFSLAGGAASSSTGGARRGGRRTMSAEARERIAAAQRARWAKQNGGKTESPKGASNGAAEKPKRKMSAAGRKAIAEAARKRWAAAKAAGKSKL
jgi:hypothetical protein